MKKKTLSTLLSGLLAVSLTGVGFASWIIVENGKETKTGSVAVETVVKDKVTLTFAWSDNDGDLNTSDDTGDSILSFGYAGAGTNTGWLRNTKEADEGCKELKFTLIGTSSEDSTVNLGASIAVVDNNNGWATATSDEKKYIKDIDVSLVDGNGTISVKWGDAFDNKNPYDYYNGEGKTAADYADEAFERLEELAELLEGVTFTLTVTGTIA